MSVFFTETYKSAHIHMDLSGFSLSSITLKIPFGSGLMVYALGSNGELSLSPGMTSYSHMSR